MSDAPEKIIADRALVTRVTVRRNEKCPTCNRPFAYMRDGTYLPPTKALIFDLVRDRPGISSNQLAERLYERDDDRARASVRVHVSQLRVLLVGSGTKIMSASELGYWLETETAADVGS